MHIYNTHTLTHTSIYIKYIYVNIDIHMSISMYTHTQGVWAATGEVWKGAGKKKSSKV
jgi:hypothetical protein